MDDEIEVVEITPPVIEVVETNTAPVIEVAEVTPSTIQVAEIAQAIVNVPIPGPQGPAGVDGAAQIPPVLDGGNF